MPRKCRGGSISRVARMQALALTNKGSPRDPEKNLKRAVVAAEASVGGRSSCFRRACCRGLCAGVSHDHSSKHGQQRLSTIRSGRRPAGRGGPLTHRPPGQHPRPFHRLGQEAGVYLAGNRHAREDLVIHPSLLHNAAQGRTSDGYGSPEMCPAPACTEPSA